MKKFTILVCNTYNDQVRIHGDMHGVDQFDEEGSDGNETGAAAHDEIERYQEERPQHGRV